MKSRWPHWYYCQSCDYKINTRTILYGEHCPKCGGSMSDMPPLPAGENLSHAPGEEGTLSHFNRYVAGDRR
jgi:hypothetical protein